MDDLTFVLHLVSRWAHILAAITAVGGTIFMRIALHPASELLPPEQRDKLRETVRMRWVLPLNISLGFLLLSGIYNIILISKAYQLPSWYHPLFGTKFLLALAIMYIAASLTGRSDRAARMRQRAKFWLTLNMTLAIIVVLISGLLRSAERIPKTAESAEPAQSAPAAL